METQPVSFFPIPPYATMHITPHKSPRPGLHLRGDLGSLTHVTLVSATTLNHLYNTIREPHYTHWIRADRCYTFVTSG